METIVSELFGGQALRFDHVPAGLVGAALFGAVIGFEREWRDHSAGLRTNMMVALASAIFAIIGIAIVAGTPPGEDRAVQVDPLRLIEAVTGGVAFLAAGIIVFAQGRVRGLSTGAAMWLSASAGLATGLGLWLLGLLAAIGGIVILGAIRIVERKLGIHGKRTYDEPDET
ncbi:MAG: MgtC/SapB family protein [Pseudomonadota bacterium]